MTNRAKPRADHSKRKCPLLAETRKRRGINALISESPDKETGDSLLGCAMTPCDGFRAATPGDKEKCRNILFDLREEWNRRKAECREENPPSGRGKTAGKNGGEHEFLAIIGSSHSVEEAMSLLFHALEDTSSDENGDGRGRIKKRITPKPLTKALQFASQHYTDPELSARRVAAASGVSQQRMAKLFREFLAITFTEWLAQYRIAKAQEYLRTSEQKILDIALACGFGAISSFNRIFRRQVGIAPRDFRQYLSSNQFN